MPSRDQQQPEEWESSRISEHFRVLQGRSASTHTNYFGQQLTAERGLVLFDEDSLLALVPDVGFSRLYFASPDENSLAAALGRLPCSAPVVTACLAKQPDTPAEAVLRRGGHRPIDTFRRMGSRPLKVCATNASLCFAEPADCEELLDHIRADFPIYTSHAPTRGMLLSYIENQWVLVLRQGSRLAAYLVFQIRGGIAHYNYVFNAGADPVQFLLMQNNFYGLLARHGVKAGILWVNELNSRVIRMHKAYGWAFDGLIARYYLLEPTMIDERAG